VPHRRQRKREAGPWQQKADENEEEEKVVAIKILKRVVLSFRCAKNNRNSFPDSIQFVLCLISSPQNNIADPVRHSTF
jgi:hypothetical protein